MESAVRVPFRAPDRSLEVIVSPDRTRAALRVDLNRTAEPERSLRRARLAELSRVVSGQLAEVVLAEVEGGRLELSLSLEHMSRAGRDRAADLLTVYAAELVHGGRL